MKTMSMDSFCGSAIWDYDLTWNTTNPDFTPCFQKTVLVWIPCGLLWLFLPFQVYLILRHKKRYIPWTTLNVWKIISAIILIVCSLIRLAYTVVYALDDKQTYDIYPVDFSYPVIDSLTYFLVLVLGAVHVRVGIHSSCLLLAFWTLKTLSGIVIFRSLMLKAVSEDFSVDIPTFVISTIEFPFIVVELILACFADTVIDSKDDNPFPIKNSSFVSIATYAYFDSLAWKGFRRPLERQDLWNLSERLQADHVYMNYHKLFVKEQSKHISVRPPRTIEVKEPEYTPYSPALRTILWQMLRLDLAKALGLKIVGEALGFVSPFMLSALIDFVTNGEPIWRGVLYSVILFLSAFLKSVVWCGHFYIMQCIGIRLRSAAISVIYRKSLRISGGAKQLYTTGEIVNLMAVDAQKLMDVWLSVGHALTMPALVITSFILLWQRLGSVVLMGLGVILVMIPINGLIVRKSTRLQRKMMKDKGTRTNQINEILEGIKILKLYGWEPSFFDQVKSIRSKELKSLKLILLLQAVLNFVFQSTPLLISLSTFATYVLSDASNILDATTAFVSLSLLDIMRFPLAQTPTAISNIIQARVSLKRIEKFLSVQELESEAVVHDSNSEPVTISEGTFSWKDDDNPTLHNINLNITEGQLVAVVGPVGCGKSSLISCMLGEMHKLKGRVSINGSVAYVAQQAWIQNAAVKTNIVFGKSMNVHRYEEIVEACALQPDFQILPAGDDTEIGEKGINLSGGQKQRISLARAVYADNDVYLFDDPLSAVDAHVGKHIFEQVLGPKGLLKKKTRILVTHGISYLPFVDSIIVMADGAIREIGSYKELLDKGGAFAEFLLTYINEHEELDDIETTELKNIQDTLLSKIEDEQLKQNFNRQLSRALSSEDGSLVEEKNTLRRRKTSEKTPETPAKKTGKLTEIEKMEIGKVNWSVNWCYAKAIGLWMTLIAIVGIALSIVSLVSTNIWLSIWTNDQPLPDGTQDIPLRNFRLTVYGSLGLSQTLCALTGSVALALGALQASKTLHNAMLLNILRCPMSFFDTTPLGRIINRFSRDVDILDTSIPQLFRTCLDNLFQLIGAIVVISLGFPIFLAAFIPFGIVYYFIQRLYIDTARQLKRMESVTRSPIYSHFSETISGLETIRAYGRQQMFVQDLEEKITENHVVVYPFLVSKRWVVIRLVGTGTLIVLLTSLLSVFGRETLNPGMVGLMISYSNQITSMFMWFVRDWTGLESDIVSIERIKEYSEAETEAPWEVENSDRKSNWPDKGCIEFQNYSTRYRKGLELVLKDICCNIQSGQKIGIVGRTGSGKSSLTLALFRIIEASEGKILIDGLDIGKIGLHDLRRQMAIIPQEPVLFNGTIRLNIDPSNDHSDEEVWQALEHSHLKEFISKQNEGLEHKVTSGGSNLSVGQRQLVCLARALLIKTNILVMDEATAAVDLETDELIQTTIRTEFVDCTVLTIAHRLNTILDSDKVMVLENGVIVEFDAPSKLLEDETTIFRSLAIDAGLIQSETKI